MKTKNKVMLGIAAMTAATLGVGTTATFAWFTTTRTATVNVSKIEAKALAGNLEIKYNPIAKGGTVAGTGTTANTYVAGGNLNVAGESTTITYATDVSGDGKTFYRPNWKPGADGTTASSITALASAENTAAVADPAAPALQNWVEFNLSFKNSGNKAIDLFLNKGSQVNAVDTGDTADVAAAKATRIAIWDSTNANCLCLWQYDNTDAATLKNVTTAAAGTALYGVDKFTTAALAAEVYTDATHVTPHEILVGEPQDVVVENQNALKNAPSEQYLGTLNAAAELTVRVAIWFEGTLTECDNDALGGQTSITLAFAGLDIHA